MHASISARDAAGAPGWLLWCSCSAQSTPFLFVFTERESNLPKIHQEEVNRKGSEAPFPETKREGMGCERLAEREHNNTKPQLATYPGTVDITAEPYTAVRTYSKSEPPLIKLHWLIAAPWILVVKTGECRNLEHTTAQYSHRNGIRYAKQRTPFLEKQVEHRRGEWWGRVLCMISLDRFLMITLYLSELRRAQKNCALLQTWEHALRQRSKLMHAYAALCSTTLTRSVRFMIRNTPTVRYGKRHSGPIHHWKK